MKKFYCLALIVLSLFSCVLFSACGDKYKDLEMSFYSEDGDLLNDINFVLDSDIEDVSQRIYIKFDDIDEKDIGEITVYSSPEGLVNASNFVYESNRCYVDVTPTRVSEAGAKLTVKHYASGKTEDIDLSIKQKAKDVQLNKDEYVVSILEDKTNKHYIDFSMLLNKLPQSSSDNVYFKLADNTSIKENGVTTISARGLSNCYTGFSVNKDAIEFDLVVYPCTYLEGYPLNEYKQKPITILFRKTLNENKINLKYKDEAIIEPLKLIYNDDNLERAIIQLFNGEEPINSAFFDLYDLTVSSSDDKKISVFADSSNNIIINAIADTEDEVVIDISFVPKNFIGDIRTITKQVKIKGEVKADSINVLKNGTEIDLTKHTSIFDYYSEGNSLGSLFTFTPFAYSGAVVNSDLNKMQIVIDPEILNADANSSNTDLNVVYTSNDFTTPSTTNEYEYGEAKINVNNRLYVLSLHKFSDTLKFYYNSSTGKMVSEPFTANDRIYIKYVYGNGALEPSNFGLDVETINNSNLPYWGVVSTTKVSLVFDRQEGVKSMALNAGHYFYNINSEQEWKVYEPTGKLETIYLNRLEGLQNTNMNAISEYPDENIGTKFIYILPDQILGVDNKVLTTANFEILVKAPSGSENPLKIKHGQCDPDVDGTEIEQGSLTLNYKYSSESAFTRDSIGLVFRGDTDIGDYQIVFMQEGVEKAKMVCRVYEALQGVDETNVVIETNQKAFANTDYTDNYKSDYIVAAGQKLDISMVLSDVVLNSNIITGYSFEFEIGSYVGDQFTPDTEDDEVEIDKTEYMFINQAKTTDNFANVEFLKGTYIEDDSYYVRLTIKVKTYVYSNIYSAPTDDYLANNMISVDFFIYEPITNDSISINHTHATKYISEYLGVYNNSEDSINLQIKMDDKLWDYVTPIDSKLVKWAIDDENGVTSSNPNGNEKEYLLTFGKLNRATSYTRVAKAYVKQFNETFYFECVINVKSPIISERIIIESSLKSYETDNKDYYINLKLGGKPYQVTAKNISSLGEVTHGGIIIQVVDDQGSAHNASEYLEIDQNTSTIKAKKVEGAPKFKLIVFAKDALKFTASIDKDYSNPSSLLMESDGEISDLYKNAYFVINIELSDGITKPYLITTAEEFFAIDDTDSYKSANYKLMNSLNLGNNLSVIEDFKGSIVTDDDFVFLISGITLNNEITSLFENFAGTIKNIKFVVKYNYDSPSQSQLGVFDENNGTLTNVYVEVTGEASLANDTYFGGLVGVNNGTIEYDSGVGASGTITLKETNAKVYFGGLVGKNTGKIKGDETSTENVSENDIVLYASNKSTSAISTIIIESYLNGEGAVGGAVGLNTYYDDVDNSKDRVGTIHNAYVQATIIANNSNNIGGVIGENNVIATALTVNIANGYISNITNVLDDAYINKAIYNVKSASTIIANNNVGGVVGLDNGGLYIETDYKILPRTTTASTITANENVGGIAGKSVYGKFFYCSVYSYNWDYAKLKTNVTEVIDNNIADISANNYVGGIVGNTESGSGNIDNGDEVSDRTIIVYSSVNAYLKTSESGNIGGLLSVNTGHAIVFNAYFIGKLEGNVYYVQPTTTDYSTHLLSFANNDYTIYNAVYTINIDANQPSGFAIGNVKDGQTSIITTSKDPSGNDVNISTSLSGNWWWNADINGGYIYVTTDSSSENKLPIFDLSPDSIDVTVKEGYQFNGKTKILKLDYYDFSNNENLSNADIINLNNTYNKKYLINNVNSLLNIGVKPSKMGRVELNVYSSNVDVVDIALDGTLIINGVGNDCVLTFKSVLNPAVYDEIKVIVDYPVGDNFVISTSRTDFNKAVTDTTIGIPNGTSKQFYALTYGEKIIDKKTGLKGVYKTKTDLNLKVEISTNATLETGKTIKDYIGVSGLNGEVDVDGNKITFKVDNKTPFTISMLKHLENTIYSVKVTPYIAFDGGIIKDDDKATEFNVSSNKGATDVTFNFDHAIVYPNDTIHLTVNVNTDTALCNVNGTIDISALQLLFNNVNGTELYGLLLNELNKDNIPYKIYVDDSSYDEDKKVQTIVLRIEFEEIDLSTEADLTLKLSTQLGTSAEVEFKLIPQRINKIEIKNYYYRNENEKVLLNVLKPSHAGLIILDIVPENGYYDHLEISDITGNEEIKFIQVDEDGKVINKTGDDISSDGKGIKLYKQADSSRIYVHTQISKDYSSKIHLVQVRAYTRDNQQIGTGFIKEIDVKMLPEINVDYLLPNGTVGRTATTSMSQSGVLLANGVNANLRITTANSDGEVVAEISGDAKDNYEFVLENGNHYLLKAKNKLTVDDLTVGDKVKLTLKTYAYMENGDSEFAETSIEFKIVSFVIHDISVNSSIETSASKEIYGYFDRDVKLNLYFNKDDISFYNDDAEGEPFWNTVYSYDANYKTKYSKDSDIYQIYSILEELNKADSPYLILNDSTKAEGIYNPVTETNISLSSENKLSVKKDYSPKYLAFAFKVYYDNAWKITEYDVNKDAVDQYDIDKNYYLNFREVTPWYEPTVITTPDQFKTMQSGGRYILANDITLTNYTPHNVNLVEFDGNGYTITIKSFATFNEEVIQAGLFAKIYPNMIVKNVKLIYSSVENNYDYTLGNVTKDGITYTDLCNNAEEINYTEAKFGGITAVNNGLITNCYVGGQIALHASSIEQKKVETSGNFVVNFYIGGMVAENSTDAETNTVGHITNCISELSIFAQANIGGFVYKNEGKIVSCGVEEDTTIYAYNINLEKTINTSVAGFAVLNSGEISMSYVNLNSVDSEIYPNTIKQGTISAKDISAGFVYDNSGTIYDAYVVMTKTGINNNTFSGFVASNSGGSITRAFTYINGGVKNAGDNMFAPASTTNLVDCIEFISFKDGYTNEIESGLKTLKIAERYTKGSYEQFNFTFGDNLSAVWSIQSGNLPKLVSTYELNIDNFAKLAITKNSPSIENGVESTTYTTSFANYGTKNNPFIVHDLTTWNDYFTSVDNKNAYFRIINDIDFTSIGGNPETSTVEFSGNIQGNNMLLKGILLYSNSSLDSLGLFKSFTSANDNEIKNSVRNLKLTTTSVWASSTQSVGLLAGIIEDFYVYNITIDASKVIMVGGNAVGGLAGVVRGEFGLGQITSNIGVNSTRATTLSNYSIYMSKNNNVDISKNLSSVYYAGSIVGVLDAYNNAGSLTDTRDILNGYYKVENIRVNGEVVIIGDTVGAAFGFVGERVYVKNVEIDIFGNLTGAQYSAGVVGENRGIVEDVKVTLADNMFTQATNVVSGAVGFNLGGLIQNINVLKANISKTQHGYTVAGVVGRNVHGTITDVTFAGELFGYYTGGIIGANYSGEILMQATAGNGAINSQCKNEFVIPRKDIEYYVGNQPIHNYTNLTLTKDTYVYLAQNSNKYYSYKKDSSNGIKSLTVSYKVLGLVVGLNYKDTIVEKDGDIYKINADTNIITFNSSTTPTVNYVVEQSVVLKDDISFTFENVNTLGVADGVYVLYLTGAKVGSFDSWDGFYSDEYILDI